MIVELERAVKDSRFFDYCHYEYKPSDFLGKLTSANLLFDSFRHSGCDHRFRKLVELIRASFGIDNTVWGVKKNGSEMKWEFYFYNYNKQDPNITVTKVLDAIRPIIDSDVKMNEKLPYFMFSIDITRNLDKIDCVHLYFPGYDREVGQCYHFSNSGLFLENSYAFFDAHKELKKVASKIKNTPIIDYTEVDPKKILCPEFIDCHTICISNKQTSDCIYFSRVKISQLCDFMDMFGYPEDLKKFIKDNKDDLMHLLPDIGFDYSMDGKKLKIVKTGYYGTF